MPKNLALLDLSSKRSKSVSFQENDLLSYSLANSEYVFVAGTWLDQRLAMSALPTIAEYHL